MCNVLKMCLRVVSYIYFQNKLQMALRIKKKNDPTKELEDKTGGEYLLLEWRTL